MVSIFRERTIGLAVIAAGVSLTATLFVIRVHSQEGLQIGYAVITPEAGGRVPVASALFSLRSEGLLISEAGVGATLPVSRGRIFVDRRDGTETGIALANPSGQAAHATLTLLDPSGDPLAGCGGEHRTVEPGGHLAKFVPELFPACAIPEGWVGSLTFEADDQGPGLAAVTLRQSLNPDRPVFATLPVVDLDPPSSAEAAPRGAASSVAFPHIGAGPADASTFLSTQLILINPSDEEASGSIRLFGDDGLPLELELEVDEGVPAQTASGGLGSVFDYILPGDGVFRGTLTTEQIVTGYAVVDSDGGQAPSGTAIFQFRGPGGAVISEAGVVGAALPTRGVRLYVDTAGTRTGVAVAATDGGGGPVRLAFRLLDRFGALVGAAETGTEAFPDLAAGGHAARFVGEKGLFAGELPEGFRGVMEIRSEAAFFAVTLKLTLDDQTAGQPVLTTLPLADLDRPLEAGFVVLPQMGFGQSGGLEFDTRLILINQDDAERAAGQLRFARSAAQGEGDQGVDWAVPLFGREASKAGYRLHPGGAGRLQPGNPATVAGVELPQAQGNEVAVAAGKSVQLRPRVIDSSGEERDDFLFEYFSLDCQVAEVDDLGRIEGKQAGFSTLIISAGEIPLPGCGDEAGANALRPLTGSDLAPQGGSPDLQSLLTITVTETGSGLGTADVRGVLQDGAGRVYLTSSEAHTVLRAPDVNQEPERFAGRAEESGLQDGPRLDALFNRPAFLAFENGIPAALYVSDSDNNLIRQVEVDPVPNPFEGEVSVLQVTEKGGDSPGLLNNPQGIALDGLGNLWVADAGSRTIRRIGLSEQAVETIAGQAGTSGCQDGVGGQARFGEPIGIFKVPQSAAQQLAEIFGPSELTMIVADRGCNSLRLIQREDAAEGVWRVETIDDSFSSSGEDFRLNAAAILFDRPEGVAVDPFGNIYVSEPESGRVRTLLTTGDVVSATQTGTLQAPEGLSVNRAGRLLVADSGTSREIAYAPPSIEQINVIDAQGNEVERPQVSIEGGETVIVKGRNFGPESLVVVESALISDARVVDTSTIEFTAPALPSGLRTLTVQHRGGLDQTALSVRSIPLRDLQPGFITTVAGGSTFTGDGNLAVEAGLRFPISVTVDAAGNLFIADRGNLRIRRVDATTGIIITVAGTGENICSEDGLPAIASSLASPQAVEVDEQGNLLISDTENHRLRRINAFSSIINTVAGDCQAGFSGDGGLAIRALLSHPMGLAVDKAANIFIADAGNQRIRQIEAATGDISTVAGNGEEGSSGDEGLASSAILNHPTGVALSNSGYLFIADTGNSRIRRVDLAQGTIRTIAGNCRLFLDAGCVVGDGAPALEAGLAKPTDIAIDSAGNLFIADAEDSRIRQIANDGFINTFSGDGSLNFSGDGGLAQEATLGAPRGVSIDGSGNLFIADTVNHRIRKVDANTQMIETVAGSDEENFLGDGGPAPEATLRLPEAVAVNEAAEIFIADTFNQRIRRIDSNGNIETVAGNGIAGFSGDGGDAREAQLQLPGGVAADRMGAIYIADTFSFRIRKVEPGGTITTVAQTNVPCSAGDSEDSLPMGLALDSDGNLFIADRGGHCIRKLQPNGDLNTVAGTGEAGFSGDGGSAIEARLNAPLGVWVDDAGNLFIADTDNYRIRKVDGSGKIITVAGNGEQDFYGDGGKAIDAAFFSPIAVAADFQGNIYVADKDNRRIRRIDPSGIIDSVVGSDATLRGDGGPAREAGLFFPRGVTVDSSGNLYIIDNNRIRAVRTPVP